MRAPPPPQHPKYGFEETPEGREALVSIAVQGTVSALEACVKAGVKRAVLTSSLAAVECGNDDQTLTEGTWSRAEVFDSSEKLEKTTWATHYTYVKSKTEQVDARPSSMPSGSMPSGSMPSGSMPSGSMPSGSMPSGSMGQWKHA